MNPNDRASTLGRRLKWAASAQMFYIDARINRNRRRNEIARRFGKYEAHDNEQTTPPPDEHVTWSALWIAELYLPTHVQDLKRGLSELGWDESGGVNRRDALSWLNKARAKGELDYIRPGFFRPKHSALFPTATPLDMPESFAFLHPMLMQVGPGVTVLVATFALAETEQGCLDRSLRDKAQVLVTPFGRTGHQMRPVSFVKQARIGSERQRIRDSAASWVRRYMPGVFLSSATEPPSWDLITTESTSLVNQELGRLDWRAILGFNYPATQWCPGKPQDALTLAIPSFPDTPKPVPTFTGLRASLIEALVEGDGESLYSLAQILEDQVAPTLGVWSALHAVEAYSEHLTVPRDKPPARRPSYRAARSQLNHLQTEVLPVARNLTTLEALSTTLREEQGYVWFQLNAEDFVQQNAQESVSLLTSLIESLERDTTRVRRSADDVMTTMRAYSETLVAASNLGLQLVILMLSVLLLIFTIAGVYIGFGDHATSVEQPSLQRTTLIAPNSTRR